MCSRRVNYVYAFLAKLWDDPLATGIRTVRVWFHCPLVEILLLYQSDIERPEQKCWWRRLCPSDWFRYIHMLLIHVGVPVLLDEFANSFSKIWSIFFSEEKWDHLPGTPRRPEPHFHSNPRWYTALLRKGPIFVFWSSCGICPPTAELMRE